MAVRFQFRRGTAAQWTAANPTLAEGELAYETDTAKIKVGDGTTAWTSLAYGGIKGDTGAAGADGADGAAGADGADGADGVDGGFDSTQTIADKSANYSLLAGDVGKLITNSAAVTITVDNVLTAGQQVDFLQTNASQITFAAGSGVTLNSKDSNLKTAAQGSPASVKCVSSGVYWLIGDLGA